MRINRMDTALFYIALLLHLISLIIGLGAVLVLDTFGLLWLAGRTTLLGVLKVAHVTQALIWLGWFGLVASGIPLLIMKGSIDNLTLMKLFFVFMIGANGILLHNVKRRFEHIARRGGSISGRDKFRIVFGTTISQIGWWAAMSIGFVHRHISHVILWPENPWGYILGISVFVLIFMILGEKFPKSVRHTK